MSLATLGLTQEFISWLKLKSMEEVYVTSDEETRADIRRAYEADGPTAIALLPQPPARHSSSPSR